MVPRFAYWVANGDIPDGMVVAHTCDNPPCCNPQHLKAWTQAENMRDMVSKGRHPYSESQKFRETRESWYSRGSHGENAKLTWDQVCQLREIYAQGGVKQVELAAKYGIAQTTVSRILRGEVYQKKRVDIPSIL